MEVPLSQVFRLFMAMASVLDGRWREGFFLCFFPVNPSVICRWISIKIERVNVIKSMGMYKDIDILCIKHE